MTLPGVTPPARAVATSRQGVFLLQDASGRHLRANPRCLLPCHSRPGVSVSGSTCRGLGKAIQWAVEPVPRGDRLDLPAAPDSEGGAHVCSPLSRLCARWFSLEREIRFVRADESGAVSEDDWISTRYTGRSTRLLKRQLLNLLSPLLISKYTLCVRAGRYGQPTPLAINLPRSREPLHIVLFQYNVSAVDQFIYPDVNAVAGASARDEQVP